MERRRQINRVILERRRLRDAANQFDRTRESFVRRYRLEQRMLISLIEELQPLATDRSSKLAIPFHIKVFFLFQGICNHCTHLFIYICFCLFFFFFQVLCTVRFFATGTYQTAIGDTCDISVAQETVSDILAEVLELFMHPTILGRYIKFPRNRAEAQICIDR